MNKELSKLNVARHGGVVAHWCGGVVGGVWNKSLQPSRVGEGLGPLKINMGECG